MASSAQVAQEQEYQKRMAFEMNMNLWKKVYPSMMRAEKAFNNFGNCANTGYATGFLLLDHRTVQPEWRAIAKRVYEIQNYPKIGLVAEGFPAFEEGIQPGAELISVDGVDCASNVCGPVGQSNNVSTYVIMDKNGNKNEYRIEKDPICQVNIQIHNSDQINAFTDGKSIILTKGIIRFSESEDELMMILAHCCPKSIKLSR
jgi:hypothetical protein